MKILSIFTALLISVVAGFSQGGPIYRNPATTNQFMNSPGAGEVPIWNSTAGKWSNGVFSATSTNIPAYVLTNNQSSAINLGSSVRVAGTQTNVGAVYFDDKWFIDSAGGFFQLSNPSSGVNAITIDESTDSITIGTAGGTPLVTVPTLLRTDSNDITGHLNVNSFYSTNGFKLSNTLIVDTNGNDSTAIRSSFLRPFLTITGAVAAVQNGDTILVRPGLYTVTPKIAETNRQGAINLFNLTNVTIISGGRGAVIDGSSALGEIFYATNCLNLTVEGFRIRGMVGTNITSIGTVNEIWGSFSYYNCPGIKIRNNFFDGGHDHGTLDMATFNSTGSGWTFIINTNPPIIEFNEFYNIGSARTNSNLNYDGTAISPTAGIIQNNWIHDCYRGIEPYAASTEANIFRGTIIRNNRIQNCLEDAITTAGSTNGWNVLIEGNRIEYNLTYTRRGTNVFEDAVAILWNSGQRPVIRGNYIYGAPYRGIQVASSLFIDEPQITGNYIEETTNNTGNATAIEVGGGTTYTVKGALVSGNTIRRARSEGLKLAGVRDSIVSHNNLIDPTSVGIEGAAIRINSDTGVNSNILVIANNVMGGASLAYGIFVDAGSKAIRLVHNQLNGASTNIFNASGAEVAILQPPTTLTASRALVLDADSRMTTASGTPDGTKFLRDDNTYAVPSVGAGDTNNIVQAVNYLSLSNNIVQQVTNIPGNTVTIDMNGPRQVRLIPTGTFAATFTNQPSAAATGPFRDLDVTVIATQTGTFDVAGPVPIDWGPDGGPVFVSGLTNRFTFRWNGTNFFGINHQATTTGTGSTYVLSTSPVLVTPHIGNASATNLTIGTTNVVAELSRKVTRVVTNYTQASITVNCSTDVFVNITNAVGGNIAITLATPVIGTSGSLSLISDGSARTLPILAPVAITWLSTNDTVSATNILTTASKRSLFCWSVRTEQAAAAAPTTNIFCWVKNQP